MLVNSLLMNHIINITEYKIPEEMKSQDILTYSIMELSNKTNKKSKHEQ